MARATLALDEQQERRSRQLLLDEGNTPRGAQ
jgi:hypothetical protein